MFRHLGVLVFLCAPVLMAGEIHFNSSQNTTSSMASKTFEGATFGTKSYEGTETIATTPALVWPESTLAKPANLPSEDVNVPALSYDATYATKTADWSSKQEYKTSSQSVFRLGSSPFTLITPGQAYEKKVSLKAYEGPESEKFQNALGEVQKGLANLKDLPNRELTVEEIKTLLNRDTKPALSQTQAQAGSGTVTAEQLMSNTKASESASPSR